MASEGHIVRFFLAATALIVALTAGFVSQNEARVCGDDCSGNPTTYGDAFYWSANRLLGGDPDGLGVVGAGSRVIGLLLTVYGVYVLVALVGRAIQRRITQDRDAVHAVVTEFERGRADRTAHAPRRAAGSRRRRTVAGTSRYSTTIRRSPGIGR